MSERNGQLGRGDGEEIAVPALAGISGADLAADTGRGNAGGAQADRGQHREHATLTEPWPGVRFGCDWPERNGPIIRPHQRLGKRDAPIQHRKRATAPAGGQRVIAVSVRERA